VVLLRDGAVDYAPWIDRFRISRREFQRDCLKLRAIGKEYGFTVTPIVGGRVFLHAASPRVRRIGNDRHEELATLARIASSLRGPAEREIRRAVDLSCANARDGFLHLREAVPSEDDRIAGIFAYLKETAAASARVEFTYTSAKGARSQRRAEPYHVVSRSGRSYLVAYDVMRRGWRYFALDAIAGPMRKDGTFAPRPVPERFLDHRAVGWINASVGARRYEVTTRIVPALAAAVTSRTWQDGQRVTKRGDRSAHAEHVAASSANALYEPVIYKDAFPVTFLGNVEQSSGETWHSATPIVLERFPKVRGTIGSRRVVDGPEEQVATMLLRTLGLAAEVEIWPAARSIERGHGGHIRVDAFRRTRFRKSTPPLPVVGAILRFEKPVSGPIVLGRLAHFGLGRFEPE
jgi:predicted DNA-binding transcriptional regulator YafY